jgi:hypothetical protein
MAANLEYRDRAAEAADYGILRALGAAGLSTAATLAQPVAVPAGDESPPSIPGSPADTYSYRLYFAGSSIPGPGLLAHHFVVECTGRSRRGASVTFVQGFRVVAAADATSLDDQPRVRSYWMQADAD